MSRAARGLSPAVGILRSTAKTGRAPPKSCEERTRRVTWDTTSEEEVVRCKRTGQLVRTGQLRVVEDVRWIPSVKSIRRAYGPYIAAALLVFLACVLLLFLVGLKNALGWRRLLGLIVFLIMYSYRQLAS